MKIYTKKGDDGTTSLIGGRRVSKCDSRVEAYGDADELISYLGVVRAHAQGEPFCSDLLQIQQHLMVVSSYLACDSAPEWLPDLDIESKLKFLESRIDKMSEQLPSRFSFVIPGPPALAAELHFARTICRRCERRICAIEQKNGTDAGCERYVNRLSDYLFTLAQVVDIQSAEKK